MPAEDNGSVISVCLNRYYKINFIIFKRSWRNDDNKERKGHVIIDRILGEKELNGKCGLYAKVTIEPGCSLGYHEHHNESETYFILAGQGDYDDNGTVRPVKAGDVTYTPDNHGHALTNTGDTDLVFMALIILD